jgi:hypothetical protein
MHIVFGDYYRSTLIRIKNQPLFEEDIISFNDDLSIGPIED